jgi:hypothetical protein
MTSTPDKTANPISSPQAQSKHELPDNEAPLEIPNPATEDVDKVITPTSIKEKERQADAIESKNDEVEERLLEDR